MSSRVPTFALAAAIAAWSGQAVVAQVTSPPTEATNNATVQAAGPRSGTAGKNFFNIQGDMSGNMTSDSYGVADFVNTGVEPGTVTAVTGLQLQLTQSNAAFTAAGQLAFFLATNTATSIEPTTSPLRFSSANLPTGVDASQGLGTLIALGTGTFTRGTSGSGNSQGTGTVDTFAFNSLSAEAQNYLTPQLNSGGPVRVIVAANDPTVAATYAGFSNTTAGLAGPTIVFTGTFTPVPEPAAVTALAAAGLGAARLARRRLRKQAAGC